ncbi:COMM domain-containing protein 1-like [Sinocyclocheilus rhinocerous]|uniref:COMM domain-containing protein 1-like n=1 Tax=Sinocyclocheilus rhinocerous TaxID=307959 RepID=UPI0007B824F6|nr:PREDICTED: COMM domain-containing protein 1-like [Sinocyclocheilus rhinocerous]
MADADSQRCVSALLNGITQRLYYGNTEITEEFLKNELYAEMTQDEFRALHDKMRSLLKSIASADMDQAQLEAFLTAQTNFVMSSEFVCLEFDEQKVNLVLKKMAELQESIDSMVHRS